MIDRVVIARRARQDAQRNRDWIAERSTAGAAAWSAALERALHSLAKNPDRHSMAPASEHSDRPVWPFLFKTRRGRVDRGLFTITDDIVLVLHIRGPGQQFLRPEDFDE